MRDATGSLQFVYGRLGVQFSNETSEPSNAPRRIHDEALNFYPQLRPYLPTLMRRRETSPENEVARSLFLHFTVGQDMLH